ncbi:MAG: c-type cytochrome [Candidatus Hinthialibacter sp.]
MSPTIPIPHDIPLPLPADADFLKLALIFLFLLHILFVNLMIGGSVFVIIYEWLGIKRPDYDRLAREIASTITVNKSMAVVLGVGPLLTINVLYTIYFYTANALTGVAWSMIIPLVSAAFLLGYAHNYSWDRLSSQKGLHISIGAGAALIFLLVPLIFLSNINLMLFPQRWPETRGWLSTLWTPNVLPRYLHFLFGSIAVSGLFFAGYFGREKYPVEERLVGLSRGRLRRMFYSIALSATAANFMAGPLLFFTLPAQGVSWPLIGVILIGVCLAAAAAVILWREITLPAAAPAWRFYLLIVLLTGTVVMMASGRHMYRENAVSVHRAHMEANTQTYISMTGAARWRDSQGLGMVQDESLSPGEKVFNNVCASCHAYDVRLVGPPLTEIAEIYPNDPAGIIQWVKKPGRKRPDYPPMPPVALSETQHQAVAQYILDRVAGGE